MYASICREIKHISSTQEVKVSNIITLSSFVYTVLTTIVIYRFNHEKK